MINRIQFGALLLCVFAIFFAKSGYADGNCDNADSNIDKIICANSKLKAVYDELIATYGDYLELSFYPDPLKANQELWIKELQKCADETCVKNKLEARVQSLPQIALELETCESAQSTMESNACMAGKVGFYDKLILDKVQGYILSTEDYVETHPPFAIDSANEALMEGYKAWLIYRDRTCDYVRYNYWGGSGAPFFAANCEIDLSKQYLKDLDGLLKY